MERKEFEKVFSEYLGKLGVKNEEVLTNTPRRVLDFLEEFTVALREPYEDVKNFEIKEGDYNQMVVMKTHFMSLCAHHLLPYTGVVYIGYLPRSAVIGASKIVKMVQHISRKPSIQEELTEEISSHIKKMVPDCLGVIVVVKAFHTCVNRYKEGWMTTSSLSGGAKHNPFVKEEFFNLIQKDEKEIF